MTARAGVGPIVQCACGCGGSMTMYDERKRVRAYLPGHHVKAMWNRVKSAPRDSTKAARLPV
jgi:hypothetical protein